MYTAEGKEDKAREQAELIAACRALLEQDDQSADQQQTATEGGTA